MVIIRKSKIQLPFAVKRDFSKTFFSEITFRKRKHSNHMKTTRRDTSFSGITFQIKEQYSQVLNYSILQLDYLS